MKFNQTNTGNNNNNTINNINNNTTRIDNNRRYSSRPITHDSKI